LQNLDADALDEAAGGWAQQRTVPAARSRRMVAVGGKTFRGSGTADDSGQHMLAAADLMPGDSASIWAWNKPAVWPVTAPG
jgi:hypothetical protein